MLVDLVLSRFLLAVLEFRCASFGESGQWRSTVRDYIEKLLDPAVAKFVNSEYRQIGRQLISFFLCHPLRLISGSSDAF